MRKRLKWGSSTIQCYKISERVVIFYVPSYRPFFLVGAEYRWGRIFSVCDMILSGNKNYSDRSLLQYNNLHQKSHMDQPGFEKGLARWQTCTNRNESTIYIYIYIYKFISYFIENTVCFQWKKLPSNAVTGRTLSYVNAHYLMLTHIILC